MIGPVTNEILNMNAALIEASGDNPLQVRPENDELHQFGRDNQLDNAVKTQISEESQMLLSQVQGETLPATQLQNNIPDYSKLLKKKNGKQGKRDDKDSEDEALSENDKEQVEELRRRDAEVRTHEQQHAAAAGPYLRGGPYYEYQTGPDGQMYAIGGHVDIDISEEDTPEATIRKAQAVRQAASAPGEPSAADQGIAREAAAMEQKARAEQVEEDAEKDENDPVNGEDDGPLSARIEKKYTPYDGFPQKGFLLNIAG